MESTQSIQPTDDEVVLALFDVVNGAAEEDKSRFYTALAAAMDYCKRQGGVRDGSYATMIEAMTPEKALVQAKKNRMLQVKMERSKKKDDNYQAVFWGLIGLSLEARAGTAKATPETLDFVQKILISTDEQFLGRKE